MSRNGRPVQIASFVSHRGRIEAEAGMQHLDVALKLFDKIFS